MENSWLNLMHFLKKTLISTETKYRLKNKNTHLTLFWRGVSGLLLEGGGGGKEATLPKICDTYPIMMKTCTVIPYLEEIRKQNGPRDTP